MTDVIATTDTGDPTAGRTTDGLAADVTAYPVEPTPAHLVVEPMRIIAMQLPTPTLVDGRPT